MRSGVYKILNKITGSCYVGSAVNLRARWAAHRHSLRHKLKSPPKLQRAWDSYGESAFEFSVLCYCEAKDTLVYEQLYIDALTPKYNTRLIARSNLGIKWSKATNKKKARKDTTVHTVQGVSGTIRELCEHFGVVGYPTAVHRIPRGWSVEKAVTTPPVSKQEIGRRAFTTHAKQGTHPAHKNATAFGVTAPLVKLHEMFGVTTLRSFRRRLNLGWALEVALTTPKLTDAERLARSISKRKGNSCR